MLLAIGLLAGAALAGALAVLQSLSPDGMFGGLLNRLGAPMKADWKSALTIVVSLAGLFGLTGFLTDYLGDVQAWATYEETDAKHVARNKVLDEALTVLTHVLSDPQCDRVAVVAHSLGTSVAHDALLALNRRNRATNPTNPMDGPLPLNKIEHFVTMGSPIDKIEYFFESYASACHRYKRVVEDLRGDIGTAPFSKNRKPYVHWINFWDEGDVISGALQSPASASHFAARVDNVHVENFAFPAPGASHSGYFDNRTSIGILFEAIYLRRHSFRTLKPAAPRKPPDYASVYLGPGKALGARTLYLLLALALPWMGLAGLILHIAGARAIGFGVWGAAGVAAIILAVSWMLGRRQLNPL
jgi:hypothetical protein